MNDKPQQDQPTAPPKPYYMKYYEDPVFAERLREAICAGLESEINQTVIQAHMAITLEQINGKLASMIQGLQALNLNLVQLIDITQQADPANRIGDIIRGGGGRTRQ